MKLLAVSLLAMAGAIGLWSVLDLGASSLDGSEGAVASVVDEGAGHEDGAPGRTSTPIRTELEVAPQPSAPVEGFGHPTPTAGPPDLRSAPHWMPLLPGAQRGPPQLHRPPRLVAAGLEVVDGATQRGIPAFRCALHTHDDLGAVEFDLASKDGRSSINVPTGMVFDLHVEAEGYETKVLPDIRVDEKDPLSLRISLVRSQSS